VLVLVSVSVSSSALLLLLAEKVANWRLAAAAG